MLLVVVLGLGRTVWALVCVSALDVFNKRPHLGLSGRRTAAALRIVHTCDGLGYSMLAFAESPLFFSSNKCGLTVASFVALTRSISMTHR